MNKVEGFRCVGGFLEILSLRTHIDDFSDFIGYLLPIENPIDVYALLYWDDIVEKENFDFDECYDYMIKYIGKWNEELNNIYNNLLNMIINIRKDELVQKDWKDSLDWINKTKNISLKRHRELQALFDIYDKETMDLFFDST